MGKKIYETLGVPKGINSFAKYIVMEIREELRKVKLPKLDFFDLLFFDLQGVIEKELVELSYDVNINDMKVPQVPFRFNIIIAREYKDKPALVRGAYGKPGSLVFNRNKPYIKSDISKSNFAIDVLVSAEQYISGNININDVIEPLGDDSLISVMVHELMHMYDVSKYDKVRMERQIDYMSYTNIPPKMGVLSKFLFLLYYTSQIENTVRPTELYQDILNSNITKKDFLDFMKKSEIIAHLDEAENFSIDKFKEDIENDPDSISFVESLYDSNIIKDTNSIADDAINYLFTKKSKEMEETSKIIFKEYEESLEIIKRKLSNFITIAYIDADISNANKYLDKIKNRVNSSNVQDFIRSMEKRLNSVGAKLKRKLYKLYDLVKDDEDTPRTNYFKNNEGYKIKRFNDI